MNNLPQLINILFIATTVLTVWLFYNASGKSNKVLIFTAAWVLLQGILGFNGFYQKTGAMPPRFILLIGPGFIICLLTLLTKRGQAFADTFQIDKLTLLHSVRIPVEITLFYVFLAGYIPKLMTFEGNNPDLISGITAPIIYYLVFFRKRLSPKILLFWNIFSLGLLINILVIAILSAQTPFQKLAFDQPNTGVTYFPYIWLPSVIVPIVLFSHLVGIMKLVKSLRKKDSMDNELKLAEI